MTAMKCQPTALLNSPDGGTAKNSCRTNTVTPDNYPKDQKAVVIEAPISKYLSADCADASSLRLKQLLNSIDFKRRKYGDGDVRSSRFTVCWSGAGAEPHKGLALRFLSSVFKDDTDTLQTSLTPEAGTFGIGAPCQMTFFILAETNLGETEVLALAHVKYYLGVGMLVKWLAVTGKNISKQLYGTKADGGSWRNRGLSTLLLTIVQKIGMRIYHVGLPRIFVQVGTDAVDAVAFYNKKGFVKVNQFPACVEKDLLQSDVSRGAMFNEHDDDILQRMELTSYLVGMQVRNERIKIRLS